MKMRKIISTSIVDGKAKAYFKVLFIFPFWGNFTRLCILAEPRCVFIYSVTKNLMRMVDLKRFRVRCYTSSVFITFALARESALE